MYATLFDIEEVFRPLTTQETVRAARLLEFADAMLRQQVPRLDARLADLSLQRDLVAAVETAMVVRVLRNPDGRVQGSETIDDYSTSWTVDKAISTGALYLAADELASLAPRGSRRTVRSVRLLSYGDTCP